MSYPDGAGHRGDNDTSIEGAAHIAGKLQHLQTQCFRAIQAAGDHGLTGDELAGLLGWVKYRVRPRLSELRQKQRIIDSGRRRRNTSGVSAIVWVAAGVRENAA